MVNQSNDQTLVLRNGKKITLFDEQATYKNPDYDVSFYTSNARLSPDLSSVAMTIVSTAQANKPIQLADQGESNPEESQRIRKALPDLPAVEVKSLGDTPQRVAFVPHAVLVGWIERERNSDHRRSCARGSQRWDGSAKEVDCAGGRCGKSVSEVRA